MENKKTERVGFFDGVRALIKSGVEKRQNDRGALLFDSVVLAVAFLFSRCHIIFGAYPLGIAFVAVLPSGVWLALVGAAVGSLTLGKAGVIHAIICVIVVFLRVIISGSRKGGEVSVFSEPLILKIASAAIGAFVGATYEILLGGFVFPLVIYGSFSVLLSAVFTFAFSGIFDTGISFSDVLFGKNRLSAKGGADGEKFTVYLFEATLLLYIFLISLSLKSYIIFGISAAYVFSALITLIGARRFGAIKGMTVGFVSSLGISSIFAVAFALLGFGSGILLTAPIAYAVIAGGALLSFWGAYAGGALGFLSVFPEYVFGAMLASPILKRIQNEKKEETPDAARYTASDMVAATSLAYKSTYQSSFVMLEEALGALSKSVRQLGEADGRISRDEYREITLECAGSFCRGCPGYNTCIEETPAPYLENVDLISTKVYSRERLFPDDSTIVPKYCHNSGGFFERLSEKVAEFEAERRRKRRVSVIAEEYELFSRLVGEVRSSVERERYQDTALCEKLSEILSSEGLSDFSVRVFGERRKHFILAGIDRDGSLVTSSALHRSIEEAAGVKLGSAEYYRKGDIALLESTAVPMYKVEFASVGKHSENELVSGDTAVSFESADGHFYSLVADGMGSGEGAHKTSHFAADFLSRILKAPCTKNTALHVLNHIIKNRNEECSSTVDLFDFDLITGEALFFKCGAAPSYVKRDGSIFRIRSETAPLGLMKGIDAERIRVEIKDGDYIIMLSDGVSQSSEESTWLLELLSEPPAADIREYAEKILAEAERHTHGLDDMSVAVAKIIKL